MITLPVFARALHVLAVVIWIGGVSMATTVVLPAVRRGQLGEDSARSFRAIQRRFVWQARAAVLVVGLSGFFMCWRLDLWQRFRETHFWWMHAMVGVWTLFVLVLAVEPLITRHRMQGHGGPPPAAAFARLHRAHWLLLVLSLATVFAAVAGSRGWSMV
ncbi:MAG: hypothetical protein JSR67_05890 [Proteobacteria bacterium]|nr:hypothetical protein [Pseudomonadota bacterium]